MLDGMPAVRVKAEPLKLEQGVSEQLFSRRFPLFIFFFSPAFLSAFPPPGNRLHNHSQAPASERESECWGD